jgi:hypothetical protein
MPKTPENDSDIALTCMTDPTHTASARQSTENSAATAIPISFILREAKNSFM